MMKNRFYFMAVFFFGTLIANAQNVASTANLTSGGLQAGTGGTENTFYGYQAGKVSVATNNTFIGDGAGAGNTSGNSNTFIGSSSGNANTFGSHNVFIGAGSGSAENNGTGNTFIGFGAGRESNGDGNVFIGRSAGHGIMGDNKLYIDNQENDIPLIWGDFALNQLKLNGKVGIGFGYGFANFPAAAGNINVSGYNLFVKGGILTEEVRVALQGTWADYVFNKDYKLPTLQEVENHIKAKGHLINVPSAKEVHENGIALGEMARIQQEKIEELTLYIIEQHKTNEKQARDIEELKAALQKLLAQKQ
ncbi:MAG TPA: hypothetical protein VFR70_07525 [Flavobacterium sp.]|nr:hypothetical protein [Flavobacterium sp.]